MFDIAVCGEGSAGFVRALEEALRVRGASAHVSRGVPEGATDVLVCLSAPKRGASARVIVTEGSGACALPDCLAEQVVTCGLSSRDTVTPSSTLQGGLAALQRELATLSGGSAEPRELDLSALEGAIEQKMMLAAVLLLLDAF
jgi:hypothetical protein